MCLSYSQINKIFIVKHLNPIYSGYFANSDDPDEMYFIRVCAVCLKIKHLGIDPNSENSACDPLNYRGRTILSISIQ